MFTIRSTRRMLDRVIAPVKTPELPSTRLGDWYANLVPLRAGEFIVCVSEKTLLPVVLPIIALPNIGQELSKALAPVLTQLGIERTLIEQEWKRAFESAGDRSWRSRGNAGSGASVWRWCFPFKALRR